MASRRNNSRRKGLLAVEIIILILLTAALVVAVWVTHKLSLVNYDSNFDRTKVKTSTEAKQQRQTVITPKIYQQVGA